MNRSRRVRTRRIGGGDVLWELRRAAPLLAEDLEARQPALAGICASLRRRFPVSGSCVTFRDGPYVRPHGHFRAFYRRVPGGAIGIKGADIFARDLDDGLAELKRQGAGTRTCLFDSLVLLERKAPLALTAAEALEEAAAGAAFQSEHLRLYGEPARAPIPLMVCRWKPAPSAGYRSRLRAALRPPEREAALALLRQGLGAIAYFYPGLPIRVRHVAQAAHNGGRDRRARLRRQRLIAAAWGDWPSERETVSRWVRLTARALAAGFSPCSPGSDRGQCLQEQNAVIDGGFADLGSMRPLGALPYDAARLAARRQLSATVDRFLNGYSPRPDARRRALVARRVDRLLASSLAAMERKA